MNGKFFFLVQSPLLDEEYQLPLDRLLEGDALPRQPTIISLIILLCGLPKTYYSSIHLSGKGDKYMKNVHVRIPWQAETSNSNSIWEYYSEMTWSRYSGSESKCLWSRLLTNEPMDTCKRTPSLFSCYVSKIRWRLSTGLRLSVGDWWSLAVVPYKITMIRADTRHVSHFQSFPGHILVETHLPVKNLDVEKKWYDFKLNHQGEKM